MAGTQIRDNNATYFGPYCKRFWKKKEIFKSNIFVDIGLKSRDGSTAQLLFSSFGRNK